MKLLLLLVVACVSAWSASGPKILAMYSEKVESDHVDFAKQAIPFLESLAKENGMQLESSEDWGKWDAAGLRNYSLVIWLNDFPHDNAQRKAFEQYMEGGGGWLGFHIAAYNDADTHWPWFVSFLGGGVFYSNNWPPLPAKLVVDGAVSGLTDGVPSSYLAPANEWYIWKPSPRENPDVRVVMTLDPSNYPLGLKDVLVGGDLPVVWTNTRYRMLYMNMGHGDKIFDDSTQNRLIKNAVLWCAKEGKRTF